ncbi:hypothetical protein AGABI2DRAFT_191028 [Agaricus bisporus var. bisporus H97]|uniref:hypothetical protein n=1 Tax=Agaricus bisporus var. bisporus (strain H97 / ATCC MYA-4626 / FGSC 10389) TaxID=936046 RepID=UPI00029F6387|nr:hypothetical protein AGABI2DRAFT_191028 [Agaricus bisporus var. bisporus H97]EKV48814.1 hypothetical protein AGABI2DRAFT_191028 [Agaricus bisporus var. bisporus H97]
MGFFENAHNFEVNGGQFIDIRGGQMQYTMNSSMNIAGNNNRAAMRPSFSPGSQHTAYNAPRYGPTQSSTSTYPGTHPPVHHPPIRRIPIHNTPIPMHHTPISRTSTGPTTQPRIPQQSSRMSTTSTRPLSSCTPTIKLDHNRILTNPDINRIFTLLSVDNGHTHITILPNLGNNSTTILLTTNNNLITTLLNNKLPRPSISISKFSIIQPPTRNIIEIQVLPLHLIPRIQTSLKLDEIWKDKTCLEETRASDRMPNLLRYSTWSFCCSLHSGLTEPLCIRQFDVFVFMLCTAFDFYLFSALVQ